MPLKTKIPAQRKPGRVSAILYRLPLPVTAVLMLNHGDTFPICPRCDRTLDREYMNYCDRCGQHLGWDLFHLARVVHAPRKSR